MQVSDFIAAPRVTRAVAELDATWDGRAVSDVVDQDGHQYVDLVMEGGGVLGVALVGYSWALERCGIRFLGVGGASAGAINALLLAAAAPPGQPRSETVLGMLAALDMGRFVDGDGDARELVDAILSGSGLLKLGWKGLQVLDNLRADLGLHPGRELLRWTSERLRERDIRTTAELLARLRDLPPSLRRREGPALPCEQANPRLAIVAAEVRTETKVVFPDMAALFWDDPAVVDPALYVRASMSIPFFFHPFVVRALPASPAAARRWEEQAGYRGRLPARAVFVDGAIMSNFPVNLFHQPGVPCAPTFGVRLGTTRMSPHAVDTPLGLLAATFNAARHTLDYDFILQHPDYRHLMQTIDTGEISWLDFSMPDATRVELFARGVEAAVAFLRRFDWPAYRAVRQEGARPVGGCIG